MRAFRVIAGAAAPRSEAELELAAKDGAEYAAQLRTHFAHVPPPEPPKPDPKPTDSSLEATAARGRCALAGHRRPRVRAPRPAGVAGVRGDRGRDRLPERLRPRRRPQPGQEPARLEQARHRGRVQALPALPCAGAGQPGRRADAAHLARPAGSRGRVGRVLEGRAEHPRRLRVPGRQHPAARPAPGRDRLQRQRQVRVEGLPGRAALARSPGLRLARVERRVGPADAEGPQPGDERPRRARAAEARQQALRRAQGGRDDRRGRRVRARDADRRAARRLRARPWRARSRDHAGAPLEDAQARPAHAATSSLARRRASRGCRSCRSRLPRGRRRRASTRSACAG